ncbi:unnamed protein product [Arctia plantaginis]|uniref:Uncharacterized protein n=1 Tax=Arctia plantaginis TaxID=874455 RepID=A0A8S0ZZN5_ARCPL|nr:unnamed protein product [Arctia plantaginis]
MYPQVKFKRFPPESLVEKIGYSHYMNPILVLCNPDPSVGKRLTADPAPRCPPVGKQPDDKLCTLLYNRGYILLRSEAVRVDGIGSIILTTAPDNDAMAPDEDLDLEDHECCPWQMKRARAQERVIVDMNARGFEIGYRFREDGTEFLPTGYSTNNSRSDVQNTFRDQVAPVKAYSVSENVDSKTNYGIPTKSYSTYAREYVSSLKSFFSSSRTDYNSDNVSTSKTSATRDYVPSLKSFFASNKNDKFHDYVSPSNDHGSSAKDEYKDENKNYNDRGYVLSLKHYGSSGKDEYKRDHVTPSKDIGSSSKDDYKRDYFSVPKTYSDSNNNNNNRDYGLPTNDYGSSGKDDYKNEHESSSKDFSSTRKDNRKYVSPSKDFDLSSKDNRDYISPSKDFGSSRKDDYKRDNVSPSNHAGSSGKEHFIYISPSDDDDNLASPSSVSSFLREYSYACKKEVSKEPSEVYKSPCKTNTIERKCCQLCESDQISTYDNDEYDSKCTLDKS